jgi:hypothetical protein
MRKAIIVGIAAATTAVSVAFAQMAPTKTGDSTKGKVLTNDAGMTLYVFDKDSGGKSACSSGPTKAGRFMRGKTIRSLVILPATVFSMELGTPLSRSAI